MDIENEICYIFRVSYKFKMIKLITKLGKKKKKEKELVL